MSTHGTVNIQADLARRRQRPGRHWQPMLLSDLDRIECMGLCWPGQARSRWALWLNALVPGTGLIALQRGSAGLPLAISFFVTTETSLFGLLIMPKAMGSTITTAAMILSAVIWLIAQILLLRRISDVHDLEHQIQAALRIDQARQAVLLAEWGNAKRLLEEAADYDAEQPELNWLLAKVLSAVSRSDVAACQWRLLRQVDRSGRYAQDIERALAPLPRKAG